jgi:outer membrane protein assembly factor BamB
MWIYTTGGFVYCSPVVADFFGNGEKEVLVGSEDYNLYCLDGIMGDKLWSCTTGCVYSSPVVADLYGDGKPEVTGGGAESVYCLRGTTGDILWSYAADGSVTSSPVVVDLFGNGTKVVIFGTSLRAGVSYGPGGAPALAGSVGDAVYCIIPPRDIPPVTSADDDSTNDFPAGFVILGIGGAVATLAVATFVKLRTSKKGRQ